MKPPRHTDDIRKPDGLKRHFERISKVLSNISVGNTILPSAPAAGSNVRLSDPDRNIEGDKFIATSPAAPNTEFSITHTLGRIPHGFMYLGGSNQGIVYRGASAWTTTQVFLKETQGSNTFVILLV